MGIIDGGADLTKLGKGAVRAVIALDPLTTPIAANIADVMAMNNAAGVYALQTGWTDIGATTEDATSYSRGIEEEELALAQLSGAVDTEVTEVPREMTLPLAHISDDSLKLIENGSVSTVAAALNKSAQKRVKFGIFPDLPVYRVALIGLRSLKAGVVTENAGGGASKRPRMVMLHFYRAQLVADTAEFEFEKGSLWSGEVGFRALPEPGVTSGEEHGSWYTEDAGTIT